MASASAYLSTNTDDHQHLEVVGDSIRAAMLEHPRNLERIVRLLNLLIRDLQLHFTIEENYMKDVDYPGLAGHQRSHLFIISELANHVRAVAMDREVADPDVWTHVKGELRRHMAIFDHDFSGFLERAPLPALFREAGDETLPTPTP